MMSEMYEFFKTCDSTVDLIFMWLTQQNTERKAKNIAPMMFDLAKENISSDCRHEFAIKMNAMA